MLLSPITNFNSGVQVPNVAFFRNNTLKNNVVYNGTRAYKTLPNCVLEVTRNANVEVYHNVFDNPGSSYDVGNGVEVTSSLDRINATLNYWGTANELIIQNRIFDFDDSSFLATIDYIPLLLSADLSDVAGSSHPRNYPLFRYSIWRGGRSAEQLCDVGSGWFSVPDHERRHDSSNRLTFY